MHAPPLTVDRAKALRRTMSLPEVLLWRELRPRACPEFRFRRQHPLGPYILDFFEPSLNLAVELDGEGHVSERDERRDRWLLARGVRTLRLPAREVLRDLQGAVATVLAAAGDPLSQLR